MQPHVAYVAFEAYPNPKGSGTRMTQMIAGLAQSGAKVSFLTLPGPQAASLPPGVSHHPLPAHDPNFLARALSFRDLVARRLRALAPSHVHFRGIFEGQAAQHYAAERGALSLFEVNGLPSVELVYHYPQLRGRRELRERLATIEAELLAQADAVITQSQSTLSYLRTRGLSPHKATAVIPNAAEPEDFCPNSPPAAIPQILYAGTMAPWQGIVELLMAARRCVATRELRFVLAGPIHRRWSKSLHEIVDRFELSEQVELCGALTRPELYRRIQESDICVAPLRRDDRNLVQGCSPIKVFEYMAAAKPCIVTDLPCTRELVEPSRGILLKSPRPRPLADAILSLLEEPQHRRAMGQKARQWIQNEASWSHRRQQLADFYRTLPPPFRPATAPSPRA